MKVTFIKNCIFNGERFSVGQCIEVSDSRIKELSGLIQQVTSEPENLTGDVAEQKSEPTPEESTKVTTRKSVRKK